MRVSNSMLGDAERELLRRIAPQLVMATLRATDSGRLVAAAEIIVAGGLTSVEITMSTPNALQAVAALRERLPDAIVGAGTVLAAGDALAALDAGAQYLVTPICNVDIVEVGAERGVPVVVGALTPTEAHRAHESGASAVKIFPVRSFGPKIVRDLLGPLPFLRLIPTGGVGLDDAGEYLSSGAIAVALGGELLGDALKGGDLLQLDARVRGLLAAIGP
ncbi:MAG: bifunctional 4-hydroxy-2-oxoglutarate aldolase/2-dehydro-3-deoxy-phosphogluconate aldolase [Acidimicrobiales bacterium]